MLIKQEANTIIDNGMLSYSAEVLLNRAIPMIQDGLKPSQRKILFTFYRNKINHLTKSMTVSGAVGAVHPHGNAYPTIVNMTQSDKNELPLFYGSGNWGQYTSTDLGAAAERYTEVKLSEFGKEMTKKLNEPLVHYTANYDGTIMVPDVIPVSYPMIFLYHSSGIGVGYSSEILPYNMGELTSAIKQYVESGVFPTIFPDFPTGGVLLENTKAAKSIIDTGKGKLELRAKIEKIDSSTLSITEIPYGSKREQIINKIVSLAKEGVLPEIKNVKDLTGFKGMNIEIRTKRNVKLDNLIKKLYKLTPLEASVHANINVIDVNNGVPEQIGVKEVIQRWLDWRQRVYKTELSIRISNLNKELTVKKGLKKVLRDIGSAIEIIRSSNKDHVMLLLKKHFDINEEQAKYICGMKLININEAYIQDSIAKINNLENELQASEKLIQDPQAMKYNILKELESISKDFGNDRKSVLKKKGTLKNSASALNIIDDSKVFIALTQKGYAFKQKKSIDRKGLTLRPGDEIIQSFSCTNDSIVEIICDNKNMYSIRVSEISYDINKFGHYLPELNPYNKDIENIINYILVNPHVSQEIIYGYSNGRVSKYSTDLIQVNKKITKNAFNSEQELVAVFEIQKEQNVSAFYGLVDSLNFKTISSSKIPLNKTKSAKGNYVARNRNTTYKYKLLDA